jgi:hypothetical protein
MIYVIYILSLHNLNILAVSSSQLEQEKDSKLASQDINLERINDSKWGMVLNFLHG